MAGVIGIVAILVVLTLSLVITRVATVALMMTGLSEEAAKFQARSAFTGTGFTTREAEAVVGHPVRRRIIMGLMVLRSAGLISIILSLILSFLGSGPEEAKIQRLGWLVGGVAVLWVVASSKRVERLMGCVIRWALERWTDLEVRDYASLLKLSGEYDVAELLVEEGDWVAGKTLGQCALAQEGLIVLGILRSDGSYVGGPRGDTEVYPGDTLIIYGRTGVLRELDKRRAGTMGDQAHEAAVCEQRRCIEEQQRRDDERKRRRAAGIV